jgi:hypothetical protein
MSKPQSPFRAWINSGGLNWILGPIMTINGVFCGVMMYHNGYKLTTILGIAGFSFLAGAFLIVVMILKRK